MTPTPPVMTRTACSAPQALGRQDVEHLVMGLHGRTVPLDKPVRHGALLLESVLEGIKAAAHEWRGGKDAEGDTPDSDPARGLGEGLHTLEQALGHHFSVGRRDDERQAARARPTRP